MTHPAPTAASKAPMLPRLGVGMGVGGLALALAVTLSTPTQAQVIPTGTPAADILLSQAIAEHRIFLTCSALDPIGHPVMVQRWEADVAAAAAILATNAVPPAAIDAFTQAARLEALLPAADLPFSELRQTCLAQTDWPARYAQGDFIRLDRQLPGAFR
jgi:hypothetical protein